MKAGSLGFLGGVLAIAATVPLAWWLLLREPPPAPPPAVEAPLPPAVRAEQVLEVSLGEVRGQVRVRRGGSDAGWELATTGMILKPTDGVRTEDESEAVLLGAQLWDVKLEPGTEIEVGELNASISKLLIETGMAKATVRGGGRHTFEVRAARSDAIARTDGGVFTIASNGAGTVAVGTQSGEVQLSGRGRVVIVREGQQSLVQPGQEPTAPAPIPSSLFLKVALPPRSLVNTRRMVLVGTSEPGALVEVGGHVVRADQRGRFETTLGLHEGKNALQISARSVGGLTRASAHQVEVDTDVKAPTIDPGLWDPKKER